MIELLPVKADKKSLSKLSGLLACGVLLCSLVACQMPSPSSSSSSIPSSGGAGGSSGAPSTPSPGGSGGGSSMPSAPSGGSGSAGGSSSAEGSQSAEGSSPNADSASTDSGGAGEPPETIEQLDDALDSSLEEFDDAVAGNDKPAPIDILSPSGSSGGVDSDEPLFEEADEGSADRSASIEERAAEGAPPNAEGSEGSGAEGAASQSASAQEGDGEIIPIPEDIDDGQGDDIVLRQIRDAATKERDPVLREKLWDEYRRIKGQG